MQTDLSITNELRDTNHSRTQRCLTRCDSETVNARGTAVVRRLVHWPLAGTVKRGAYKQVGAASSPLLAIPVICYMTQMCETAEQQSAMC